MLAGQPRLRAAVGIDRRGGLRNPLDRLCLTRTEMFIVVFPEKGKGQLNRYAVYPFPSRHPRGEGWIVGAFED